MRNVQLDMDRLGLGTMNSMETRVCLPGGDGVLSATLFCSFEICDLFFLSIQLHSLAASIFTYNDGQSVGNIPDGKLLELCVNDDDVCNGSGAFVKAAVHLSCGDNATQTANFITGVTGVQ